MSSVFGKVLKMINICTALVLAVAGVWSIVSLQVFKTLNTWYFFQFFMPFFMILLGIALLVLEFKRPFMEKYFYFLCTLGGRGLFNIFLASMSVYAIGVGEIVPFVYSCVLFCFGVFYLLLSCFYLLMYQRFSFIKQNHRTSELKEELV